MLTILLAYEVFAASPREERRGLSQDPDGQAFLALLQDGRNLGAQVNSEDIVDTVAEELARQRRLALTQRDGARADLATVGAVRQFEQGEADAYAKALREKGIVIAGKDPAEVHRQFRDKVQARVPDFTELRRRHQLDERYMTREVMQEMVACKQVLDAYKGATPGHTPTTPPLQPATPPPQPQFDSPHNIGDLSDGEGSQHEGEGALEQLDDLSNGDEPEGGSEHQ